MANELSLTLAFTYLKGTFASFARQLAQNLNITVAGQEVVHKTQVIGLTEEALDMGELGTAGYGFFKNLDTANTTNVIHLRASTGAANTVKLGAGQVACFPLSSSAPFAITVSTASPTVTSRLEYIIFEA